MKNLRQCVKCSPPLNGNLVARLVNLLKLEGCMLLLTFLILLGPLVAQESYDAHFQAAERAKAKSDYVSMEVSLKKVLQFDPDGEYVWRSLVWAQARQGKWRESLTNAWENIRRHGERDWSLRQLFDSAMAAGDCQATSTNKNTTFHALDFIWFPSCFTPVSIWYGKR